MRHCLFASLLVACFVPALSAPALAAHHGQGYGRGDRHVARQEPYDVTHHIARRYAMPMQGETFGRGFYNYAPAMQTRRNSERDNRQQNGWSQRSRSRNAFGQNTFGETSGLNQQYSELDGIMASAQASANGIPVSLVQRVIKRESGGNPRAVSRGNYGLMQIRLGTARAMGFSGPAAELLDPQVNMTYAVRYLAGAYRAAGGNESRAVALYASGYYYQAKAQGFSPYAPQPS